MSPTQRTLKALRQSGYLVAVVEHWNSYVKIRQDLFGFADVIAVLGDSVVLIQCTSGSNVASRIAKITANPSAKIWASGLNRHILVHGWRKVGPRGKRKTWQCREQIVRP